MSQNASARPSALELNEVVPLIRADLPTLDEVSAEFKEILSSGRISNFGKYLTRLETSVSKYLDAETIAVSSGTMGLILSLQALGFGEGQKALLPSFSFMATGQAVLYAGGTPVFAECNEDMTISVGDMVALLEKDKAITMIIGVHTYGLPAQVNEIQKAVDEINRKQNRNIKIVYDAAHAFGASIDGRKLGSFGNAEVFSLSVTKTLVCVEGGFISSRDSAFIHKLKKMRNYGIESNYDAHYPGLNGKMSEFHAVVGYHNLQNIESILSTRAKNASYYTKEVSTKTHFKPMVSPKNVVHTYKDYTIFVPEKLAGKRDKIIDFLKDKGVETRAYFFPPIHEQKFFKRFATRVLPQTEKLSRMVITLPFFTTMTKAQMDRVVSVLVEAEEKIR